MSILTYKITTCSRNLKGRCIDKKNYNTLKPVSCEVVWLKWKALEAI